MILSTMNNVVLPAEWAPQSAVLMAWPHENSDWAYILEEVQSCFREIIAAITRFEKVVLIVPDNKVAEAFKSIHGNKVMPVVAATNDTWARDFGPLTVFKNGKPVCLDFKFNGWGLKFAADKDNLLNRELFNNNILHRDTVHENRLNFVLEGGAIESDGLGTLLTTSECLLSPNRNGQWSKTEIEAYLKEAFGLSRVLWVNNGYLSGDDTDSHIDTLARFCTPDTIAYVKCTDETDEHFSALNDMEAELMAFKTAAGESYKLIALPMADEVLFDGERLPATYANFLIINGAVLMPTYDSPKDAEAKEKLQKAFPDREIIGINCVPLIKQHGSLHCVTMQIPATTL